MARKREPRLIPDRPYVRSPVAKPISLERAVEEGLLIARSALTMEVKNRIIVSALRDDHRFDAGETASWVGLELKNLSREQAEYAERMAKLASELTNARGSTSREHDYGPRDSRMLTRRKLAYAGLSEELARLVNDAAFVESVVEDARGQAWSELGRAIESSLDLAPSQQPDADYPVERDTRVRAFVAIDLARLQRSAGTIHEN
ncbi:MAG: hypothetical protein V4531_08580 [Actinomycetota bacterium]